MIEITIPIKIVSIANMRLHWAAKARLTKLQRLAALKAMIENAAPPQTPMTILLTRVAPRKLDSDNLSSGFKAVRDGIADWLQIDDGHPGIDWQYKQRTGKPKEYFVEVEVIA